MSRILVVSSDYVGRRMAGPAIRATEIARVLAREHQVTVAAPNDEPVPGLEVVSFKKTPLAQLVDGADIVFSQGIGVPVRPLLKPNHILILDWYDPNPVEVMAHHRDSDPRLARRSQEYLRRILSPLAKRADHIVCATDRQRDFWLGLLAAEGRLSYLADKSDPGLRDLISIVPFGISGQPPRADEKVLKGVWPGIGPDDKVLLWGGGIWNWFDPLTVIRAVGRAARERDDIRLFFMGIGHPNPSIGGLTMVQRAIDLAGELGLKDRAVFFNHGWVDYDLRAAYLLESDAAAMAAGDDLETRLSFRTRLLDCLWAGLPMIVSDGDYFAELIQSRNLGRVTGVGDDQAMAGAILELMADEAELGRCRERIALTAADFTWNKVTEPLTEFCRSPRRHPDAVHTRAGSLGLLGRYALGAAAVINRYGGWEMVWKRLLKRS